MLSDSSEPNSSEPNSSKQPLDLPICEDDVTSADMASSEVVEPELVADVSINGVGLATSDSTTSDSTTSDSAEAPLEWLHPTSLVFDVIAHGRTYIVPAIIALFSAAQGSSGGIFLAACIFMPAILVSVFRYFTLRFVIRGSELVVTEGLLFRKVRIVPISRIQNVDLVQNVLSRILGVAEVRVETASGTEPEAVLRVLSLSKIERLRSEIFSRREPATSLGVGGLGLSAVDGVVAGDGIKSDKPETILQIPTRWLVRAGLASNRGFLMVGVLVGIYFQFDHDFEVFKNLKLDRLVDLIPANMGIWNQVMTGLVVTIVFLLLLRVVGIAWFLLRFHGYRLVRLGEDLRISCGLFTKVSATVPIRRVQFVSVHQNLLMRFMKMASIRIETAGGAGSEAESATATVARRWFIPVLPLTQVERILPLLREELDWQMEGVDWERLAPRAGARMTRIAIYQSLGLIMFGTVFALFQMFYLKDMGGQWWAFSLFVGWVFAPIIIFYAIKKSRSKRYARTDYGVVYQSGILTRKTSMTFFEKMQGLRIDQSPFDRRWKMARLSIDTAAAGPADHFISVPYMDVTFVRREFNELHRKAAFHQPRFG